MTPEQAELFYNVHGRIQDDDLKIDRKDYEGAINAAYEMLEQACQEVGKLKADAVMEFANAMIGAYETGFIDNHESNLADVYQCAKAHVKLTYNVSVPTIDEAWGKDVASWCKNGVPAKSETPKTTRIETVKGDLNINL